MHFFSTSSLSLVIASTLLLSACQSYVKPPAAVSINPENPEIATSNTATTNANSDNPAITERQFQLQGKIGVRTPQQSGSAFFTWIQQQEQFNLELTGILGLGKTQIFGQPGKVTLNSAKTGLIEAETPEELLERATGWQAPITHLVDWVQGRSVSTDAKTVSDTQQRLQHIEEAGWQVDLSYNGQAILPNRLILKQALDNAAENRITMIIQNR